MEKLLKKAKFIAVFLFAISFIGCEEDETVLPKIIADFSYTLNEESATLTFINTSEGANKYEWNFGEGEDDTSTEINPVKTYTQSGTYTITLKVSNNAGASATFEDEVTIGILEGIALPITFDDSNVGYDGIVGDNIGFSIVTNSEAGNGNTTNVGQMVAGGGQFQNVQFPLGTTVDFNGENKTIQLELFSSAEIAVLVKFEDGTGGARDVEVGITHTGSGWETLSFDFATEAVASFIEGDPENGQALVPDGQYGKIILFIGFNTDPGVQGTFLVDNIMQTAAPMEENGCADTPVAATSLPLDFEGCDTFPAADNFGEGLTSMLASNPDKTGINTSDFVLQIDKPTGSDFFAGIQNTFENNFDLTTTNTFKAKVYSTKANVVFRFELLANPNDGSIGNPAPVFVTIPNANEWTEVDILFTGLPAGPMAYNQLVIKPDNTQTDDPITDGGTYYFDDLTLEAADTGGGTVPTTSAPVPPSRDAGDVISIYGESYTNVAGINYDPNWGQSGHQQVDVSYDPGDGNLAMAYLNFNYQGTDFSSTPQDASSMEFLHVDMWTADATDVRVTPINGAGSPTEALVSLTPITTGQWNSYDIAISEYTASGMTLDQIIQLKFDGQEGTTPSNIYLDNIYFYKEPSTGGGTGGCSGNAVAATTIPVDFEGCQSFISTFSSIGDGGVVSSLDTNPSKSGINTSDNVLKVVRAANINRWGGVQNSFPNGVIDITTKVFKIKVFSTVADVTYRFELALDPQTDPVTGNPAPVFHQVSGGANTWTEIEFTFTNLPATPTTYNQLVIKPDNPEGSDGELTTEERIFYFDDLRLE